VLERNCPVWDWLACWLASLIYTLNPAVLLNGRRAMFEGGLLLFSTLLVLTALWYLRDRRWWQVIVMGIITGLAITSKHTAVFVVIAVFLPLGLMCIFPVFKPKYLIQLIIAGVIGLGVFYIFNPVWWGNPLERIGHVLEARADLLATQTAVFGGYSDFTDKTFGFWRQSFAVVPQYFEVDGWQNYIGTEINDYENSLFSGLYFGVIGGVLLSMFFVGGIIHTVKNRNQAGYLLLTWAGVVLLGTWLITPIEWQRYYLLAYPIISIYAASGGVMLWDTFGKSRFLTQNQ
jgi:4-amino-4-deoxy-L-arabinose transferase-like glycosyltransferase